MRVFVAGATGAIGSPLVEILTMRGHEVTGTTRSVDRARGLEATGATPKVLDALDGDAVKDAVGEAAPDVIVHQLTAIPPAVDLRHFDEAFAQTNRLRTEGTDHLIAAAEAAAVRRFVAQSFAPWPYARRGSRVKTEEDALDDDPPAQVRRTVDAIRYLEHATIDGPFDGLALRYGWFYGPGSGLERTGPIADTVRRRRFPIRRVGRGGVVLHSSGRCSRGHRARGGARPAGPLQRHGRRTGDRARMAPRVRRGDRRAASASRAEVARPSVRWRAQRDRDDRTSRSLEREG